MSKNKIVIGILILTMLIGIKIDNPICMYMPFVGIHCCFTFCYQA